MIYNYQYSFANYLEDWGRLIIFAENENYEQE